MILDKLVDAAIENDFYTADGERVMLRIRDLVELDLVDASARERLRHRLDEWCAANLDTPCDRGREDARREVDRMLAIEDRKF